MQSHSCFTYRLNVAQCPVQKYLMSYNRYKLKEKRRIIFIKNNVVE